MLDASMLVDDNCVQLAASLADVLTTLTTSTIFLRSQLPDVNNGTAAITVYSLAFTGVTSQKPDGDEPDELSPDHYNTFETFFPSEIISIVYLQGGSSGTVTSLSVTGFGAVASIGV